MVVVLCGLGGWKRAVVAMAPLLEIYEDMQVEPAVVGAIRANSALASLWWCIRSLPRLRHVHCGIGIIPALPGRLCSRLDMVGSWSFSASMWVVRSALRPVVCGFSGTQPPAQRNDRASGDDVNCLSRYPQGCLWIPEYLAALAQGRIAGWHFLCSGTALKFRRISVSSKAMQLATGGVQLACAFSVRSLCLQAVTRTICRCRAILPGAAQLRDGTAKPRR